MMDIHDTVLYKPTLAEKRNEDMYLLIDPETPNWVCVNEIGAKIIRLCDGTNTIKDIITKLDGNLNGCSKEDVREFIKKTVETGIIKPEPFTMPTYPGRHECITPSLLRELWVYLTNKCNLRCKHCLVKGGEEVNDDLNTEEFKRVFEEAKSLGVKRIFFTGGEPFLRDDIFDLIDYITEDLRLELMILTNGTLLNEGRVKKLAKIPKLILQISLESATSEIHDKIRGKGSHERAVRAMKLLVDHGINSVITSTAMKSNMDDLPNITEFLDDMGIKFHHILWLHERGRAPENSIEGNAKEMLKTMRKLKERTKNRRIVVDNWETYRSRIIGKRGRKVDGCQAGFDVINIDANGDVYPCASVNGDESFCMGNVKERSLRSIWLNSEIAQKIRSINVNMLENCSSCTFKYLCGGGCWCQAYFAHKEKYGRGDLFAPDPYCKTMKGMLVDSIWDLVEPNGSNKPEILKVMEPTLPSCAADSGIASINNTFEVGTSHCSCVLATEVEGDVCVPMGFKTWEAVMTKYSEAAIAPDEECCCPTDYNSEDLRDIPDEVKKLSYGCGNPVALGDVCEGEYILDIGSGGGIDCFIAAKKVGAKGKVIGLDMTDEMLENARKNAPVIAKRLGYDVVEFRKGQAEAIPIEDNSIDLVISNCVINLSPDKKKVFKEIYRILKEGGRISISDIVSDREVPEHMKADKELWAQCISGALTREKYLKALEEAGFYGLTIEKSFLWKEIEGIGFHSITIKAYK